MIPACAIYLEILCWHITALITFPATSSRHISHVSRYSSEEIEIEGGRRLVSLKSDTNSYTADSAQPLLVALVGASRRRSGGL